MLSAIVLATDAKTPLAASDAIVRTLSALVPAAIEGLLRDVTLAGLMGGELPHIADHAGCTLIESEDARAVLREALAAARGPNVLIIRAGRAPEAGYIEEIADLLAGRGAAERGALLRDRPETFLSRTFPGLAPVAGVISTREALMKLGATSLSSLARRAGPAVTLRVRARRVD
jgi:hypothetical protein